jgi:hypothetical protein
VNDHRFTFKRTLSNLANANFRCFCECAQIQINWIICERSQNKMYGIFETAHRYKFTERSFKIYRSNLREFLIATTPRFPVYFGMPTNQNSKRIWESKQIHLKGHSAIIHSPKLMESLWLAKVLNTVNYLKVNKSKLHGLFWIPKNQNLRTLWECAQIQNKRTCECQQTNICWIFMNAIYPHLRDILWMSTDPNLSDFVNSY